MINGRGHGVSPIRKGYPYDDIEALDIMVEDYINTGKLKAAQAKYGLPDPEQFTK